MIGKGTIKYSINSGMLLRDTGGYRGIHKDTGGLQRTRETQIPNWGWGRRPKGRRIWTPFSRWRPYRVEYTGSLPTSEVKRRRARLVLGWGTAWEHLRVLSAFPFFPKNVWVLNFSGFKNGLLRTRREDCFEEKSRGGVYFWVFSVFGFLGSKNYENEANHHCGSRRDF